MQGRAVIYPALVQLVGTCINGCAFCFVCLFAVFLFSLSLSLSLFFFYLSWRSCHMPGSTGPDGKGEKPGFYHLAKIKDYKLCIGLVEASERREWNSMYGISRALKSNLQTKFAQFNYY